MADLPKDARNASTAQAAPIVGGLQQFDIAAGLLLTIAIAAAAFVLRLIPGVGVLSPLILAVVIGMACNATIGLPVWARAGIAFVLRRILRFAIVLLGLQLTVA